MYNRNAVAAYVCWKCKKGTGFRFQLFNVKLEQYNSKGNRIVVKTNDYICNNCKKEGFYLPETKDSSRISLPHLTKQEYKKLQEQERQAQIQERINLQKSIDAAAPQPEPDVVQIKKEGNTTIQKVESPT